MTGQPEMTVAGLDHCGNSPRMAVTGDLVVAWAEHDDAALAAWFADEAEHALSTFRAPGVVTNLTVHGLLSHGREAACDGTATLSDGGVVDFAHHFTFSSAGKQAKVRSVRTYLISRTL